jgi:hypothetical protein
MVMVWLVEVGGWSLVGRCRQGAGKVGGMVQTTRVWGSIILGEDYEFL